jgi:hypothetical protein
MGRMFDNAAVRYPVMPNLSFYAQRDFDISSYFMVVKPTLARSFSCKHVHWTDLPHGHAHSRY